MKAVGMKTRLPVKQAVESLRRQGVNWKQKQVKKS